MARADYAFRDLYVRQFVPFMRMGMRSAPSGELIRAVINYEHDFASEAASGLPAHDTRKGATLIIPFQALTTLLAAASPFRAK